MDLLDGALNVSPLTFMGLSEDELYPLVEVDFTNVERGTPTADQFKEFCQLLCNRKW